MVVDAGKHPDKTLLDEAKLSEGQLAFVKLAVCKDRVHDIAD